MLNSLQLSFFLFQILAVAITVSLWYRRRLDFHSFSSITDFEIETSILLSHNGANHPKEQFRQSTFPQEGCSYLKKVITTFYPVLTCSSLLCLSTKLLYLFLIDSYLELVSEPDIYVLCVRRLQQS